MAVEYFWRQPNSITVDDIHAAVQKFPQFITGKFDVYGSGGTTILHVVVATTNKVDVLRCILGYSPDISVKGGFGTGRYTALEMAQELVRDGIDKKAMIETLKEYEARPWKHEESELVDPDITDDNSDEHSSFLPGIFNKRTLGVVGVLALAGIVYTYFNNSKKTQTN